MRGVYLSKICTKGVSESMEREQIEVARALWNDIRSNTRVLAMGIARTRRINLDIDDTSRPWIARYQTSFPLQRCGTMHFDSEANVIGWQVGEESRSLNCVGHGLNDGEHARTKHEMTREFLGRLFGIDSST
jgi:hypothetical protein